MSAARITLVVGGVCLVLITILSLGSMVVKRMQPESTSVSYPMPNYAFGRLPRVAFPASTDVRPETYTSMVGSWPEFGQRTVGATMVSVYRLSTPSYQLSADQQARSIARSLAFADEPQVVGRTYRYTYPGPPLQETLEIDRKTLYVSLHTDYLASTNLFGVTTSSGEHLIPTRLSAIQAVRNYLQVAGLSTSGLSDQNTSVEYVTSLGGVLQPVQSVGEADYVTVSLARQPLSGLINGVSTTYSFYGPNGYASVYGVVGRYLDGSDIVVDLEYDYFNLNLSDSGTYVLRTVAAAWENLLAGDAYIMNPRGVRNAVIRSVELGYYEAHEEQDYLMPIYVFKGDNNFVAYVQALHPQVIY